MYVKQKFADGQILKAEHLNYIENGIVELDTKMDDVSVTAPVFDLEEMGLSAIPLTGGTAQIETDTSELYEALNKGAVTFTVPVIMDGSTIKANLTMHSLTDGVSMHQCVSTFMSNTIYYLMIVVMSNAIQVVTTSLNSFIDESINSALEGDY